MRRVDTAALFRAFLSSGRFPETASFPHPDPLLQAPVKIRRGISGLRQRWHDGSLAHPPPPPTSQPKGICYHQGGRSQAYQQTKRTTPRFPTHKRCICGTSGSVYPRRSPTPRQRTSIDPRGPHSYPRPAHASYSGTVETKHAPDRAARLLVPIAVSSRQRPSSGWCWHRYPPQRAPQRLHLKTRAPGCVPVGLSRRRRASTHTSMESSKRCARCNAAVEMPALLVAREGDRGHERTHPRPRCSAGMIKHCCIVYSCSPTGETPREGSTMVGCAPHFRERKPCKGTRGCHLPTHRVPAR